ncbi:ABC transporter permease [Carbonactinospora thermoautotrophica]|uniref:ABC transporter permease n=1 Tax=Carbonactinospora thermoautotrophica TaxID=1469144 RepID=A0A132N264_9ACTN|nr:ABC transporter permease [Carbonactinospora thermoautotrophica]
MSPLALLVAWQAASSAGVLPERLLASPARVAAAAWELTSAGTLPAALAISLERVAAGFALGAAAGLGLSLVAGLSRLGENVLDPPLQMLRALPHFGLIPLLILWFGIGEAPKIALVALGVAFPLYVNTFSGIRGADAKLIEVAQVLRLSRAQRIWHVILPSALPQALVGLRQSLAAAWLALIVGEQVNAEAGLGYLVTDAREFLRTDVIVLGLLIYSLLGLLTDALVRYAERRALAWRLSFVRP